MNLGEEHLLDPDRLQRHTEEGLFLAVPCVPLRQETEWVEAMEAGWNGLGGDRGEIVEAAMSLRPQEKRANLFGDDQASVKISTMSHLSLRAAEGGEAISLCRERRLLRSRSLS